MSKSNGGPAAFQANIEAMRRQGEARRAERAREAAANKAAHEERMAARAREAMAAKLAKRLDGTRSRDEHNAKLRGERSSRVLRDQQIKATRLRVA